MKKIIFVRHGRAEEDSSDILDFERSLTVKGKLLTRLMTQKIRNKEKDLGILVTSPAFRAIETALIFSSGFGTRPEDIIMNSEIYHGLNLKNLTEILSGINEEMQVITVFGHNPSISEIADSLCKEGCEILPKSGVACVTFKIQTWSEIGRNNGKLEYFLKPSKSND